jgi:hypothetical protein
LDSRDKCRPTVTTGCIGGKVAKIAHLDKDSQQPLDIVYSGLHLRFIRACAIQFVHVRFNLCIYDSICAFGFQFVHLQFNMGICDSILAFTIQFVHL